MGAGVEQLTRIAVAMARAALVSPENPLCSACVEMLAVSGAGITIMGGDQAGPLCVSNARMAALEDVQFTVGEGPSRDAFRSRRPVLAPSLDVSAAIRWPAFVESASATGVGAVFAYPLMSHGATIGVLTLYQDEPGALSSTQHDDSVTVAEVLTQAVLSVQDSAPAGTLAAGLDDAVAYRSEIYQAAGMVAVQLHVSAVEAMSRVRAYAFARDQPLAAVAAEIVNRRLRLTDDRIHPHEGP